MQTLQTNEEGPIRAQDWPTFIPRMSEAFTQGLTAAADAGTDSFSFEFETPGGMMTMCCVIREKAAADLMMAAMVQLREQLIAGGGSFDPIGKAAAMGTEGVKP